MTNEERIDWSVAPTIAGGYIVVNVDGQFHACWVLDPELDPGCTGHARRVRAPTFDITDVPEGEAWTCMRKGHIYHPWFVRGIEKAFAHQKERERQAHDMMTLPPEPDFRRQDEYPRSELSMSVAAGLDVETLASAIQAFRVHSAAQ